LGRIIDRAGHRGRLEASYFGVWNLVIKLALAAAAGFALPALALLNYIPGQSNAQPSSLIALQWAYAGVPCLLKCIAIVFLGKLKSPEKI
jgi:GPH family glycoside/pentoside/hexuronide:cation symporter